MGGLLRAIDLAGMAALLLWGVRMVQTGVERGFGPSLRRVLRGALRRRLAAFMAGLGVTAVLQSSTATGLMVAGFAAGGVMALEPALAALLGANLGSTLIVQLLSFDVAGAAPALILIGVLLFRRGGPGRWRDGGRIAIGLGLTLLALHRLAGLAAGVAVVGPMRAVLAAYPLADLVLAGLAAWAAHSSVAVVLAVMSFTGHGVLAPGAAAAMVFGANLGSAVNPVLEAEGVGWSARRVPVGGLALRALGVGVGMAALPRIAAWLPDSARGVADLHTAFNLILAVLALPLLTPIAALLRRLLPAAPAADDPGAPRYLDQGSLATPGLALASAGREALRLADALERMLLAAADAVAGGDPRALDAVRRQDDVLDRLHAAIRGFLSALEPDGLSEADRRRLTQTLLFIANLEAAGDALDRDLLRPAARRARRGVVPEPATRAEVADMLRLLAGTTRRAGAVFLTADPATARTLAEEKTGFRDREVAASLWASPADADLLRAAKLVNAHLVAAAAYPVLEGEGALRPTRLR